MLVIIIIITYDGVLFFLYRLLLLLFLYRYFFHISRIYYDLNEILQRYDKHCAVDIGM